MKQASGHIYDTYVHENTIYISRDNVLLTCMPLSTDRFFFLSLNKGNLALRQPANMSTSLNNAVTAGSAVDGNPQATLYWESKYWCAVTNLSTDPWWRVDLGKSYIVEEVKIFSRADGDGSGLINFEIRIGR